MVITVFSMGKFVPLHLNSEGVQKSFPIGTHQEEMLLMFCNLVAPPRRWHQRSIFRPHTFRHLFAVGEGVWRKSRHRFSACWRLQHCDLVLLGELSVPLILLVDLVAILKLLWSMSLESGCLFASLCPISICVNLTNPMHPLGHVSIGNAFGSVYHVHSFSPRERGCLEDLKWFDLMISTFWQYFDRAVSAELMARYPFLLLTFGECWGLGIPGPGASWT